MENRKRPIADTSNLGKQVHVCPGVLAKQGKTQSGVTLTNQQTNGTRVGRLRQVERSKRLNLNIEHSCLSGGETGWHHHRSFCPSLFVWRKELTRTFFSVHFFLRRRPAVYLVQTDGQILTCKKGGSNTKKNYNNARHPRPPRRITETSISRCRSSELSICPSRQTL